MTRKLEHGAVWLADLNPWGGTEPGKTRPVLIIQNQARLDVSHPSTLVIPVTTRPCAYVSAPGTAWIGIPTS